MIMKQNVFVIVNTHSHCSGESMLSLGSNYGKCGNSASFAQDIPSDPVRKASPQFHFLNRFAVPIVLPHVQPLNYFIE